MVETNSKIKTDIQSLSITSSLVELYSLDATSLGGDVYYFTPAVEGGTNIVFNGIMYGQLPVEFTGMEVTGDGRLPRPHMKVSNTNLAFIGVVNSCQDGVGAKITRIRTFQKYIDGHAEADSNAQFPKDVFFIEQKVSQNKYYIEWELVAPIDIGNRNIPKNQVLESCGHYYRIFKDGAFDYSQVTCPYTGSGYFTNGGVACAAALDKCGKRLSDCELRYTAAGVILPFKGFPGVGLLGRAYR